MVRIAQLNLFIGLALIAPGTSHAESSTEESALVEYLNKKYSPGLFGLQNVRTHSDGSYSRQVDTGTSITPVSVWRPVRQLGEFCEERGGKFRIVLSAEHPTEATELASMSFGGEKIEVSHSELWRWAGESSAERVFADGGFRLFFEKSGVNSSALQERSRTEPPFGLYQCSDEFGGHKWAVALMPRGLAVKEVGYNGAVFNVGVRPITRQFIYQNRLARSRAAELARSRTAEIENQRIEEQNRRIMENERLAQWRKTIAIGTETNCGLVVDIRGPIVQVQLPAWLAGSRIDSLRWILREDLRDGMPDRSCEI